MAHVRARTKTFFEDFDRANNAFDPDLLAPQLSNPLLSADPDGSIHVVQKDDVLTRLGERQAYLSGQSQELGYLGQDDGLGVELGSVQRVRRLFAAGL